MYKNDFCINNITSYLFTALKSKLRNYSLIAIKKSQEIRVINKMYIL
jgi:hypothetical protein